TVCRIDAGASPVKSRGGGGVMAYIILAAPCIWSSEDSPGWKTSYWTATETAMRVNFEIIAPLSAAPLELANRTPALRQWPSPAPQRLRPCARKSQSPPPSMPHSTRRGHGRETAPRRAALHGKYRAARSRNGCGRQPDP